MPCGKRRKKINTEEDKNKMDSKSRKELQAKYKEREVVGGICAIRNTLNARVLVEATTDIRKSNNRFEFSVSTGSCVNMKLQSDWSKQDGKGFTFEVLEELVKGENQTDKDFRADIDTLKDMWLEKLSGEELY